MTRASSTTLSRQWVAENLPLRPRRAHKGDFGRLLVVAGSSEYPGAALLVGLAAMRAGAGMVRIAAAESVVTQLAGVVPELTWMVLDQEAPGLIAPSGWRQIANESSRYDAAVIGPGLGAQPATQRRTRNLIVSLPIPAVIDADGLNALAAGAKWWSGLRSPLVLTPHPGEFARLTGRSVPANDDGRADVARDAAATWGQVVVLKGGNTVIASPDGDLRQSDVMTPALATAGTGDLLAGVTGAFLAAGRPPFVAAACAVGVHAAAGLLAEDRIGRAGVMATDVARLLPGAISALSGGAAG